MLHGTAAAMADYEYAHYSCTGTGQYDLLFGAFAIIQLYIHSDDTHTVEL